MEKLFLILLLAAVLIIFGSIYIASPLIKCYIKPANRWSLPTIVPAHFKNQDQLIRRLGQKASLSNANYESIFKYFLLDIEAYTSSGRARIVYPGVPGTRGSVAEGLKGFARTFVLLSSWLSARRPETIPLEDGQQFHILKHLINNIVEGNSTGIDAKGDHYKKEIIICCPKNIPNESSALPSLEFLRMSFFHLTYSQSEKDFFEFKILEPDINKTNIFPNLLFHEYIKTITINQ